MYWVLQDNLWHESGMRNLVETLDRLNIPHSEHKVVPFIGEIEPDINPEGHVMCMGSYSMRHLAKKKGWTPGVFDLSEFTYSVAKHMFGTEMLNYDAKHCSFYDALYVFDSIAEDGLVFIRPDSDSKSISGTVMDRDELYRQWYMLYALKHEDDYVYDPNMLNMETRVILSKPKNIRREYRFWIVDGKVITASQYKMGDRVIYSENIDFDVESYAVEMANEYDYHKKFYAENPPRAIVMDVALLNDDTKKIVEFNTLNSAGLYAADVNRLVMAIEDMKF